MTPELLPPDQGLGALIAQVVDDAKAFVAAEVALYRAKALSWVGTIKVVAALGAAALVLVISAIIALLVGLILTLQPVVGAGWATVIVVAVTLAIAVLLGWLAAARIGKIIPETGA